MSKSTPASRFAAILKTLAATLPAKATDTPEIRARRLAAAEAQFAAFAPADVLEAHLAVLAIATMYGAEDLLQRAATPGIDAETAARLRRSALTSTRFSASTLRAIRRHRQHVTAAAHQPEPRPAPQAILHLDVVNPLDRHGKPIPM